MMNRTMTVEFSMDFTELEDVVEKEECAIKIRELLSGVFEDGTNINVLSVDDTEYSPYE